MEGGAGRGERYRQTDRQRGILVAVTSGAEEGGERACVYGRSSPLI